MLRSLIRTIRPGHTTLGLEISDTSVKLCEVQQSGSQRVKITNAASVSLVEGTMQDGRILDEMLLRQAIEQLLAMRKWKTNCVHFAIPSQSVMVRLLKLPNVPYKDLAKIIDFELNNNIHLPFDDPHYDFVKLEKTNVQHGRQKKSAVSPGMVARQQIAAAKDVLNSGIENNESTPNQAVLCEIMLIAVSKDILFQYLSVFKDVQLDLLSIEIKAFSLFRLLTRHLQAGADDLLLLIDVNDTSCDLTIINHGVIKLTRNVPVTFAAQSDQTHAQVAAEQLFSDFLPKHEQLSYEGAFNDLVAEVERFMNFYRYTLNNREHEFKQIVLSGDIPMIDDLHHFIADRFAVQVTMITPASTGVESTNNGSESASSVALGLALRGKA